jgi:hypothetical protein
VRGILGNLFQIVRTLKIQIGKANMNIYGNLELFYFRVASKHLTFDLEFPNE